MNSTSTQNAKARRAAKRANARATTMRVPKHLCLTKPNGDSLQVLRSKIAAGHCLFLGIVVNLGFSTAFIKFGDESFLCATYGRARVNNLSFALKKGQRVIVRVENLQVSTHSRTQQQVTDIRLTVVQQQEACVLASTPSCKGKKQPKAAKETKVADEMKGSVWDVLAVDSDSDDGGDDEDENEEPNTKKDEEKGSLP